MQKYFVFKIFSIIFLVMLYCSRAPLNATTLSTESTFNDSLEKTETHPLLESNTFTNLIEIDHIAINSDDELLQMAKDNEWPGTGDESDPIIIEGYHFRYNGNMFIVDGTELYWEFSNNVLFGTDDRWCAIVISDLKNCKISDNYFTRGSVGIHSIRVHDCQFINNVFDFQSWDGVFLEDSYNNIILENTFIKGGEGGVFGWAGSIDNTILYNEVFGSPYGFLLWGDADGNTIQHNSIHDISYRGLDIQASNNIIQENDIHDVDGDAIYVSGFETEIKNNRIYNNSGYGIQFSSGSGFATIENNVVICNQAGGINLHLSNYNHIENNDFYNNSWCQAWDSGNNNIFTDNYWHEWVGNDTDENEIIDVPKLINGGTNTDPRPRVSPVNTIPSWYDFQPITGSPPNPEPTEITTTTTNSYTITDPNLSTTTDTAILILSVGTGVGVALLIVIIFVQRRNQLM